MSVTLILLVDERPKLNLATCCKYKKSIIDANKPYSVETGAPVLAADLVLADAKDHGLGLKNTYTLYVLCHL